MTLDTHVHFKQKETIFSNRRTGRGQCQHLQHFLEHYGGRRAKELATQLQETTLAHRVLKHHDPDTDITYYTTTINITD